MNSSTWQAIEAVGTLGAFFTGFLLLRAQLRDKRAEQASRVSISRSAAQYVGRLDLVLQNLSDQPIYDVYPAIPGYRHVPDGAPMIRGHAVEEFVLDTTVPPFREVNQVGVYFTDSAGRLWTRLPNGRLVDRTRTARFLRWAWNLPDGSRRRNIAVWLATRYGERFPRGHFATLNPPPETSTTRVP